MKITTLFLLLAFALVTIQAQHVAVIWKDSVPGRIGDDPADVPTVTVYQAKTAQEFNPGVLICPGGGYVTHAWEKEGVEVAEWFNKRGITAFILKYRLNTWDNKKYCHPAQYNDAVRAMQYIRSNASVFGVDTSNLGVVGFSAGGHLASLLATHIAKGNRMATDPVERMSARPDFVVLAYPVISMMSKFTHKFSRRMLAGKNPDPKLIEYLSTELHVSDSTPPTFLFHTHADETVPAENSVLYYMELKRYHIPAELHIFQEGKHGAGLAHTDPVLSEWTELLEKWLIMQGVINK
jgi:acetyl esterase/lipase